MDSFETFPEQDEAKRLLRAALAEGPAHAYLLHGPRGVGKRRAAIAFAGVHLARVGDTADERLELRVRLCQRPTNTGAEYRAQVERQLFVLL